MRFVEYLDWDSKFFGFNIGRINIDSDVIGPGTLDEAISEARSNSIKCLYLETSFCHPEVLAYCSEKKFCLVDFKTTLTKTLSSRKEELNSGNVAYEVRDEYYPFLEEIVSQISKKSRYARDTRFGFEASLRLYKEWLRKSIYERFCEELIIYTSARRPIGLITLRIKNGAPFIDLLGVSVDEQGRGVGRHLIRVAERRMFEAGFNLLKVTTQGHNIRALRFYQSNGFVIESVNVFYHKWVD